MKNLLIIFGAKYLIILVVVVALWYFLIQPREIKRQLIVFGLLAMPLSYVLAKVSSYFYYDPRPFVLGNFTPLISHVQDNGFPSDHTLFSGAIAAVVFGFNKKIGTLLFILAVAVGASRVAAGVHHVVDIVGSIVIVLIVAFLIYKFLLPMTLKAKLFLQR